jgi:hypothetical protein
MSEILSMLENPLIQLLLIAGAMMGLSWVSEREEQRRVTQGLPRRALKERVVQGLGLVAPAQATAPVNEDVWVVAARELELPIEKVLQLKERVQREKEPQGHVALKKERGKRKNLTPATQAQQLPDGVVQRQTDRVKQEGERGE